ncbi:MAG: D-alanyl-D-alanine carboxypeptidase [Ferruginibacter sp.]
MQIRRMHLLCFLLLNFYFLLFLTSCSISKQISKKADSILLKDTVISKGHIGISIYEPATNTYWYNYNADKYFIPASNTKLFTLYAGMKYLGDSLVGLRYQLMSDTAINIFPTADPTFFHSDFKTNPVFEFLKSEKRTKYITQNSTWRENGLGYGWAWDDYNDDYMVERSAMPIFGNTVKIDTAKIIYNKFYVDINWKADPQYFTNLIDSFYTLPIKLKARMYPDSAKASKELLSFSIKRNIHDNNFVIKTSPTKFRKQEIPFITENLNPTIGILKNDFGINVKYGMIFDNGLYPGVPPHFKIYTIHSQPTDSLFKPMMHRSDNFFAEQTLLMVSNEHLGYMSDEKIIDTLLKNDLKDVPQKPKWVDGSGLSRYNLFTPQTFVYILNKTKNEFGWERIKNILATGGTGTLTAYFKKDSSFIYAKTGTLSNNCALSGYLITQKGKLLIFSILANNYPTGATPVRKAVEKFLLDIRKNY